MQMDLGNALGKRARRACGRFFAVGRGETGLVVIVVGRRGVEQSGSSSGS